MQPDVSVDRTMTERDQQPPLIDAGGWTECGPRRKNEENFLVARLCRSLNLLGSSRPEPLLERSEISGYLLMVADGVGGHPGGGVASAVVIDSFAEHVMSLMGWPGPSVPEPTAKTLHQLGAAMQRCHAHLRRGAAKRRPDPELEATATVAFVAWPWLLVAHVGDSRAYVLRHGELFQLTQEHTVGERLRRSVAPDGSGQLSSQFDHVLVHALSPNQGAIVPEVHRLRLDKDDALLLCTDGVSGAVEHDHIRSVISGPGSADHLARLLVTTAVSGGATDNMTAVVARLSGNDPSANT